MIGLRPFETCINHTSDASGFIFEILPINTSLPGTNITVEWSCTPGNSPYINDSSNSSRNWALRQPLSSVPWTPAHFAGYNELGSWAKISNQTLCFDNDSNSIWVSTCILVNYADCDSTLPGFTKNAYWQYNVFPQTFYAYCRGIVAVSFSANQTISSSSPSTPFTFTGSVLTLTGTVSLTSNSAITLQPNQAINFTDGCIQFAGSLTVSPGKNGDVTTPIYYSCLNTSRFDNVNVMSDSSGDTTCVSNVTYGARSMSVIFSRDCGASKNKSRASNWSSSGSGCFCSAGGFDYTNSRIVISF